jgi:magnesium-transporting ATPase (P-type)
MKLSIKLGIIFTSLLCILFLFLNLSHAHPGDHGPIKPILEQAEALRGIKTTTKIIILNQILGTIISILVFYDAKNILSKKNGYFIGEHNPKLWAILVFISWLAVFPLYLIDRRKAFRQENNT